MARQFGATPWGLAWIDAIESRADGDSGRLSRGRTYARQGKVHAVEVLPGRVAGRVTGTGLEPEEYTADVTVRALSETDWELLIECIVQRAAHAAALLTGALPVALLTDAAAVGVTILPGPDDLQLDCTCPDWGDPCKHVAALCYLITDLIDADPFTVLLLRGRNRSDVLDDLRRARLATAPVIDLDADDQAGEGQLFDAGPPVEAPGVDALEHYRRSAAPLPSLPVRSPGFLRSARPVAILHRPPIDSGVRLGALEELVIDTARRAVAVIDGERSSGLELPVEADGARRAADLASDPERLVDLADQLAVDASTLAGWAVAWRVGAAAGLDIARTPWRPSSEQLEPGRRALGERARTSANTVNAGGVQLRLDTSARWWRFGANETLGWVLEAGGFEDPVDALDSAAP